MDGTINPTVLAWMIFYFLYPWLCVILLVPYSLGTHAHLGGGSTAERLGSTLAYGWVERCNDVAGCRASPSWDNCPCLFHLCNYIWWLMNYDEHVECLNVCLLPLCMWMTMHLSMFYVLRILFQHFMYVHVHGASCPDVWWFGSILFTGQRVGDVTEGHQHVINHVW